MPLKKHLQSDYSKWHKHISFCGFKGSNPGIGSNRYVWYVDSSDSFLYFLSLYKDNVCRRCIAKADNKFPGIYEKHLSLENLKKEPVL